MQNLNIFKVLHFEKENRNILLDVLKYICHSTRKKIVLSLQRKTDKKICDNCFKLDDNIEGLGCSYISSSYYFKNNRFLHIIYRYEFCKRCIEEHNNENTVMSEKSHCWFGLFFLEHRCDLESLEFRKLFRYEIKVQVLSEDVKLYSKGLKPSQFISKYMVLTPETKIGDHLAGKISPPFSEFLKRM